MLVPTWKCVVDEHCCIGDSVVVIAVDFDVVDGFGTPSGSEALHSDWS